MGICISSASSEIHQAEEDALQNVIYFKDDCISSNGNQKLGSLYSKQGSKGLNQDSALLHLGYGGEDGALCGVFDGHGKNGHIISKIVRNRLPSLLLSQTKALATQNGNNDFQLQLCKEASLTAFKVMDKEVKLRENLDCSCSGTTAVVVVKQGEDLVISNLGDSRAILGTLSEDGIMAMQLTTDLKPSQPGEAERIKKCNGRVHALKEEPHIQRVWLPNEDYPGLAMSRAFGDFLLKNHGVIALPDISHHRITSDDQFIVLATDGVWDVLSNSQVASIVWGADDEQTAAKAIVEAATASWRHKFPGSKVDDCTAVCLFLQKKQQQ
ncbi:Protein phosphatase 2C family protein [Euphorbia peplus]|nr:Protein phosphatase 2C family protein [Euphorbia peplus]